MDAFHVISVEEVGEVVLAVGAFVIRMSAQIKDQFPALVLKCEGNLEVALHWTTLLTAPSYDRFNPDKLKKSLPLKILQPFRANTLDVSKSNNAIFI